MSTAVVETKTMSTSTPIALLTSPLPSKTSYSSATVPQKMAHDMVHLHNLVIRGFNSILLQSPYVRPGTAAATDLLLFTKFTCSFLLHHHDTEEKFFFPELEKAIGEAGYMASNIEEHKEFEGALLDLMKYAEETNRSQYSSEKLLSMLQVLTPPLVKHLSDEITTLLNLEGRASKKVLQKVWDGSAAYAKKSNSDENVVLPQLMGLHDVTFPRGNEGSISPPWFLSYLTSWVFEKKHAGAWRFLPCDAWGKPKPLTFLPKELGGLGVTE